MVGATKGSRENNGVRPSCSIEHFAEEIHWPTDGAHQNRVSEKVPETLETTLTGRFWGDRIPSTTSRWLTSELLGKLSTCNGGTSAESTTVSRSTLHRSVLPTEIALKHNHWARHRNLRLDSKRNVHLSNSESLRQLGKPRQLKTLLESLRSTRQAQQHDHLGVSSRPERHLQLTTYTIIVLCSHNVRRVRL